jgi:hypothetical protein
VDWLFVPVSNPSGRDLVANAAKERTRFQRNTQQLCHRGNARLVDLNRNWPQPNNPRRYANDTTAAHSAEEDPGPAPFSEAETRNLLRLVSDFRPDILLSLHTGDYAILAPYDDLREPPPEHEHTMKLVNWMAQMGPCKKLYNCTLMQASRGLYTSHGTMTDFVYRNKLCTFPLTLEMYHGAPIERDDSEGPVTAQPGDLAARCFDFFNPPQQSQLDQIRLWNGLWRGLYYMTPRNYAYLLKMRTEAVAASDD